MKVNTAVGRGVKFERVRRITGYLTGSLDKWNSAKQAEERERVKHMRSPELRAAKEER